MSKYSLSRRRMVRNLGVAGASFLTRNATYGADAGLQVAGQPVEIQLTSMSRHTFRLTVQLIQNGKLVDIADDGTLVETSFCVPAARVRGSRSRAIPCPWPSRRPTARRFSISRSTGRPL